MPSRNHFEHQIWGSGFKGIVKLRGLCFLINVFEPIVWFVRLQPKWEKLNNSRSTAELHLNDNESAIFATLGKNPLHIERIIADTGFKAGQINAGLISLRLKGLIKPQAGSFYVRSDA